MNKTILLADDDRLILGTMSRGLRLSGYNVLEATSGDTAIKLAQDQKPDIAVLDIRMPKMTGIDVAKHLVRILDIPVIFLSAYSDEDTVKAAIASGCMNYLVKPCSLEQLILTIEAVIERNKEIINLKYENKQLDKALSQSRSVCIAIGLIMKNQLLTEEAAFDYLRKNARDQRRKITELAEEVIQTFAGQDNLSQTHL
ncbi:ANTAR domain-containing response regulator [Methylotuvimicrobium buryatense]|uniref:Response regulator n=1 Tax=Methylotuvimicrobium buryatense TaxID=95641 RepID=A0A4P9UP28_METBY|nr:response regulator [Methylotuvimicrobium buryatense]QCW82283.1 response regulator [Methylotuvimicrobium buryatense]